MGFGSGFTQSMINRSKDNARFRKKRARFHDSYYDFPKGKINIRNQTKIELTEEERLYLEWKCKDDLRALKLQNKMVGIITPVLIIFVMSLIIFWIMN
ncbi:MAG: hypothetical protein ACI94Y_003014 [Maribacter sp.]|jgi:hypothetical protein